MQTLGDSMASIVKDKNGRKRILFFNSDGERKAIRLGTASMHDARTVATRVELLVSAKVNGTSVQSDTTNWLTSIGDELYTKLVKHGLVAPRVKQQAVTLAAFLDGFIAKQSDKKPSTITCLTQCRNDLVEYFGADKPIDSITEGDAEDWRHFLRTRKARPGRQKSATARASQSSKRDRDKPKQPPKRLQENTIRRRCGRARQLFQAAVRHRLIARNPFAELKGVSVLANRSRDYFITRDEADKVLADCPDSQWKLLFALSRFGGLRCPSEHLGLRWGDVNWALGRITIRSPKTEHHEGKSERVIPLFPELLPYLEAVRDEFLASDFDPKIQRMSEQPVITRYRTVNINLRTQLQRIIRKAGLTPWPKLFQNLRATRETELAETFPIHVVCDWIGNSEAVARRHYLQTTDAHFQAAVSANPPVPSTDPPDSGQAAQKAAHNTTPSVGMDRNTSEANYEISDEYVNPPIPLVFNMAEAGVEPARGLPPNGF
jgi:integrase